MRIGITGRIHKEETFEIIKGLSGWLEKRDVKVYVEKEIGAVINHPNSVPYAELPESVDIVIVFGGDGTLLRVARLVSK